jgi:hypothetical protein
MTSRSSFVTPEPWPTQENRRRFKEEAGGHLHDKFLKPSDIIQGKISVDIQIDEHQRTGFLGRMGV